MRITAEIHVLSKDVYQLIAAGEVVERPASAVKEMVENSVDAGAKSVTVEIKNGGSSYIRITDNGSGIEKSEVAKVFVSHATSKIAQKEDLEAIGTLGFRGEAMSSIGAVAKVELLTRAKGAETGSRYVIHGGSEVSFDDAGCPAGTTIVVRDLFYNVPARMKFLKKDVTEGNAVSAVVERMALSHPEVSFRFIRDGKQALFTSGNGVLADTIYSVLGGEFSETLVPVDYTYGGVQVQGFVSSPLFTRKSRAMQFFFINGRIVRSKTMLAALEQAYKNMIMVGKFPACVLNVQLNTSLVDVNVHPAKTEVRFTNEKPGVDAVYYGVRSAVEQNRDVRRAHVPPAQKDAQDFLVQPQPPRQFHFKAAVRSETETPSFTVQAPQTYVAPAEVVSAQATQSVAQEGTQTKANTAASSPAVAGTAPPAKPPKADAVPQTAQMPVSAERMPKDATGAETLTDRETPPAFRVIGEAFKTYILVEQENTLLLIDKHAAHERMNYERLKAGDDVYAQVLLSPVAVKLSPDEYTAVVDNLDVLGAAGFAAEDFGNSTILVRECPSLLSGEDVAAVIVEVAGKLLENKTDITPDKIEWIYHSTACRSAVKAGDFTSAFEMQRFVEKLFSMPQIRFCPHGRPIFIRFSRYELEKQFGRIQ